MSAIFFPGRKDSGSQAVEMKETKHDDIRWYSRVPPIQLCYSLDQSRVSQSETRQCSKRSQERECNVYENVLNHLESWGTPQWWFSRRYCETSGTSCRFVVKTQYLILSWPRLQRHCHKLKLRTTNPFINVSYRKRQFPFKLFIWNLQLILQYELCDKRKL